MCLISHDYTCFWPLILPDCLDIRLLTVTIILIPESVIEEDRLGGPLETNVELHLCVM